MKRLFLLVAACLLVASTFAQKRVYCEIVEYSMLSGKSIKVSVDFGQERDKGDAKQVLVDGNGKELIFNSKIEALNYMDSLGWNFVQAYSVVSGGSSTSTSIHWLLSKSVVAGEDPYKGLLTKELYNK